MRILLFSFLFVSFQTHSAECMQANGATSPFESVPTVFSNLSSEIVSDSCSSSDEKLDVRVSTQLGVVTYMESLIGEMGRPESFYSEFMESKFNTPKNAKVLDRFLKWHEETRNSSIPENQSSLDKTQELVKLAAISSNERMFLRKAKAKLGNQSFIEFKKAYKKIKPIYKEMVKKKTKVPLKSYLKKFKAKGCKWKMKEKTKCMAKFTRSNPEVAMNSPIGLYPSTANGGVDGQSFVGVELLAVNPNSNDVHGDLSVVLHEKFHTLFHTQSGNNHEEMKKWFGNDEKGKLAFLNFEEAIATIAGNVWAYKKVTNKTPQEPWYNVPSIDLYAKALAPMMKEYLDGCKPMDQKFVEFALKQYSTLPVSVKDADLKQLQEMPQGQQ